MAPRFSTKPLYRGEVALKPFSAKDYTWAIWPTYLVSVFLVTVFGGRHLW